VYDSHGTIWRPRATEGPLRIGRAASDLDERAWITFASVDSTRTEVLDPSRLATLRARVAQADRRVRELSAEQTDLRRQVLAEMIEEADRSLRAEGEALAYGLAVASHERAMRQGGTMALGERLREATGRYDRFLVEYPAAEARSEIRYRLADARMAVAREEFRAQMAQFVGGGAIPDENERVALAPFVDYEPALELYLAILEDDPEWAHRDAALFHAGMILSDDADPRALRYLRELVERFPESEHVQEAHLRLGDDLFLGRDFAGSVPHFEEAAGGPEPEHAAIALYKAGWAHYNRDRFRSGADAFRRLLDLYEQSPEAARTTDLRREAEEYLVHCLARAGGVSAFVELFDEAGRRPYEADTLTRLSHLLRRFSLFDEAADADRTWLERYGDHPDALATVERLAQTLERAGHPTAARAALLEWAPHFFYGSEWHRANPNPAVQREAAEFAQDSYKQVALHYHHRARETNDPDDWSQALELYGQVVARWPTGPSAPTFHYYAGEAASALGMRERAISHFESAAASDTASFAADAAWHAIAVRDEWYESSRPDSGGTGADSLALAVIRSVDRFAESHGSDQRAPALLWRKGHLAIEQGNAGVAAAAFGEIVRTFPDDEHSPLAERYRAQSFYDAEEFQAAGFSFSNAVILARKTGQDSLAMAIAPLVPHCTFRHAEKLRATEPAESGRIFEELTTRWPGFTLTDQALYRSGLAYGEAGQPDDALRVLAKLLEKHPRSEYRRDAYLEIADHWERQDRPISAAQTLAGFAEAFPADPDAPVALLRAADLLDANASPIQAEQLRSNYLERFPEDALTALEILEPRARRDLELVGPSRPISILVDEESEYLPGADLRRYLDLAVKHDSLAAPDIFAEVSYHRGVEAFGVYRDARLTQPVDRAIRVKKERLETVLEQMRASASYGVAPWNRAATYRIGESLVAFGDALMESERPRGLSGDDLAAYDEVLEEQSSDFYDKGEEAWRALLRRATESGTEDEWTEKTRAALWPRMAARFIHRPEVDYPLVGIEIPKGGDR
jgi:tetratricopeptide (TPR) repeat protein